MATDDSAAVDQVRILIGERPEIAPPSRRAKHLRSSSVSAPPQRAHSYVVATVGDVFGVVPYDRSGRPIRLHALGSATYPSIEAASAAIRSYEALDARSRSREDG
ncbi:MAG: hypothetical protein ABI175_12165 [Polyangiales bacterium]